MLNGSALQKLLGGLSIGIGTGLGLACAWLIYQTVLPLRKKDRSCWSHQERLIDDRKTFLPKRIILVRHGESEGNVNENIYAEVPDSKLHLTRNGWHQSQLAGKFMKQHFIGDQSVRFIVSPYVRTMETFEGIIHAWGVTKSDVQWVEEPRIREQDFGNYQDPKVMPKLKSERKRFGSFFYRFPNGESGADVYDRVSSFLESLWRSFMAKPADVYVIVTHGLAIRIFWMRFFKKTVDEFETVDNFHNCEFLVIQRNNGYFDVEAVAELRCLEGNASDLGRCIDPLNSPLRRKVNLEGEDMLEDGKEEEAMRVRDNLRIKPKQWCSSMRSYRDITSFITEEEGRSGDKAMEERLPDTTATSASSLNTTPVVSPVAKFLERHSIKLQRHENFGLSLDSPQYVDSDSPDGDERDGWEDVNNSESETEDGNKQLRKSKKSASKTHSPRVGDHSFEATLTMRDSYDAMLASRDFKILSKR